MEHKDSLLINGFDGHETHSRPGDGLANGRSIGGIVLSTPDIRV